MDNSISIKVFAVGAMTVCIHAQKGDITDKYQPEVAQCQDWTPWRDALKIQSLGGAYVVEYIFFILYSVSTTPDNQPQRLT